MNSPIQFDQVRLPPEARALRAEVREFLRQEIAAGTFAWSVDAEDVHLNIERRLTALVGEAGKRLHTARSRNDQVATDVRLYLRAAIDGIDALAKRLQLALVDLAERHAATAMPGFETPPGTWQIVNKAANPTWVNPDPNGWGAGEPAEIPPGPGNPLGTRALYLNAPGIRIHGTYDSGSIGTYASHGCIRMNISDSEELYGIVPIGTPVLII